MTAPVTTTPIPALALPSTPVSTAAVAAHNDILNSILKSIESLPQSAENAKKYLDVKAQMTATWVDAKHVKTRLLEVSAIVLAFGLILGFVIGRFL